MRSWELAEGHFIGALAMHERMGARPWVARTQLAYASMLLSRRRRGDRAQARELLSEAVQIAESLGMPVVAARADELRGVAGPRIRGGEMSAAAPRVREVAKPSTVFVCSACGTESAKWHGQCPGCGAWNTLAEEAARAKGARPSGRAVKPVRLADVRAERHARLSTGIGELDRILGGGLVPGSLVLIGGSPGIGKSTLTSMALGNLQGAGRRTLYVSGEESAAQIRLRAERLPGAALDVPVLSETDLDSVLATLDAERPEVCVIDSVQTLHAADLT